jgi:hypothetical protein
VVGVPDLLEIPAGKLDRWAEPLRPRARLAEEIAADHWEPMHDFFTTPGFADDASTCSGHRAARPSPEGRTDERIEVVRWRSSASTTPSRRATTQVAHRLLSLAQRQAPRAVRAP